MTKSELYAALIDVQKKTGQGTSGIIRVMGERSEQVNQYLEELIEEGLIKCCDTGGSLGHPESNKFYMPTKGYNVWEDDGVDGQYQRHKGRYLHFVRFYLGTYDKEDKPMPSEKSDNYTQRALFDHTMFDLLRNPETMKEYSAWLTRNHKELEIMMNLNEVYSPKDAKFEFTTEEEKWLKNKEWFKENKNITVAIKKAKEGAETYLRRIEINTELITLYKRSGSAEYTEKLKEAKDDLAADEKDPFIRKKVLTWMGTLNGTKKIQDAFKELEIKQSLKKEEAGEIVNLAHEAKKNIAKSSRNTKIKVAVTKRK